MAENTGLRNHLQEEGEAALVIKQDTVTVGERLSYGCGDMGCNVVYGMIATLLTLFYTDYVGVSMAAIGTVMLLSRFLDGTSDVIMGLITAKTRSRWGQARPWLLWMSVPYALAAIALFTVPQTTEQMQFWYLLITYNLSATVTYTAINIPYGVLPVRMTRSSRERDILSVFRQTMSALARVVVVTSTLPLVRLFGDNQQAWIKAIALWSAVAVVLFLTCFKNCKEKVQFMEQKKQPKVSLGKNLKALAANKYFVIFILLWTITCMSTTLIGTILPYYCRYILDNDTWMYSALYFTETGMLILGGVLSPFFLKRMSKKELALYGCMLAAAGQLLFSLNVYSFQWAFATSIIRGLGESALTAIIFGMLGDVVEYGQWKNKFRQASLICGAGSFGYKIGMGLTSAAISSLLHMGGYISSNAGGAIQSESAKTMILRIYQFGPVIIWGTAAIALLFYHLDKEYPRIMEELAVRESRGEM